MTGCEGKLKMNNYAWGFGAARISLAIGFKLLKGLSQN